MDTFEERAAKAAREAEEAQKKFEAEQAAWNIEYYEDRRKDREEKIERRLAIEAEDDAMARSTKIYEARAKSLANPKPDAEKNKRWPNPRRAVIPKPPKLPVTKGKKIGNGYLSHDVNGHEMAAIEDVNAELRKQSRLDFEVDEAEPRELNFLTFEDMVGSYEAMMFLHCMGLDWNVWYTCTWASVELTTDEQVKEAITRHVESLRKWVTKKRKSDKEKKFFYIWCVERGEKRGLHFHMLCHIPADVNLGLFGKQIDRNIFTLTGMRPRVPAGGRRKTARRGKLPNGESTAHVDDTCTVYVVRNTNVDQQWKRWCYMMKGLDPEEGMRIPGRGLREKITIHEYLGLDRGSHEGRYRGLRLGVSKWLKQKERGIFASSNGMPENPLWTAKKPADLYGDQFLRWAEAKRKPKPEPVPEPEPRGTLIKSLDIWL